MPNRPLILRAASVVEPLRLLVDGYPDHRHRLTTRIGGEPLEDGRDVVDHAVAAPKDLVLTGIVSDFNGTQRPRAAWRAIEDLHARAEPVRVTTEWQTYDEMIIRRCEGVAAGRGLRFEMELEEVIRVSDATAPSTPAAALAGSAANRSGELSRGRVQLEIESQVLSSSF